MHLTLFIYAASLTEFLSTAGYITLGILGLGVVIFVHELGHFLAAKICGVKCEKFYVGFDPPLKYLPSALFKKRIGETEYGIGIVPLGGYVKMLGQDDNPANAAKEAERIRVAREKGEIIDGEPEYEIDPRSYPAKSVGQRLFIISAGVIMNLIFAVIFGMLAYRMGVSYTPCVVGHTSPGLSGWQVGLQQGDQILQVGHDGKNSENLRFFKDMIFDVIKGGAGNDIELLVRRYGESEAKWIPVHLTASSDESDDRPYIGIGPIAGPKNEIGALFEASFEHVPTVQAQPPLEKGDQVVAINGQSVKDHVKLSRILANSVDQEITLTVVRHGEEKDGPTKRLDVKIQPNRMRWLGLGMKIGPVAAVQAGSPAESAGFKKGDLLISINGEPITNGLLVPHQLRRLAGTTAEFIVRREMDGNPEEVSLSAQLRAPTMRQIIPGQIVGYVSAEALGIAYPVTNVVASVEAGSPAEKHGLMAGDTISQVKFIASSPQNRKLQGSPKESIDLEESKNSWPSIQYLMQFCLPDTMVELVYIRDEKSNTAEMQPVQSSEWNVEHRGLRFVAEERIHKVQNLSEAFSLGLRETYDGLFQVVFMLQKLFSGEASPKNLGGPLTIAYVAGAEAKSGAARLLTFLTMLSANLAVLNFLPIPVLDGGHAIFLIYEGVFRKPLDERIAFFLTLAGFCFILGLMIFVFGLDIWRFAEMFG